MKVTFSIVGIGVSSPMLDRAVLDEPREFEASSSANTKAAVGKLAKADAQMKVALVVLESTGGFKRTIMAATKGSDA